VVERKWPEVLAGGKRKLVTMVPSPWGLGFSVKLTCGTIHAQAEGQSGNGCSFSRRFAKLPLGEQPWRAARL